MLKSRRRLWLVLLLALVCAGCAMAVPTPDPVTIAFVYPEYNDAGQYEGWAEQFHELYPYITVELNPVQQVTPATVGERDVFLASQFELPVYLENRAVLSLSSFVEQDEDLAPGDFYQGALDVFTSEGKVWGLPTGVDMMVMYYNRDIFDRYTVPYPDFGWTWDDLEILAQETSRPPDLFGLALHYRDQFAIFEPVMYIYQHGGRIFDSLQNPTTATLNDPLNIEAMEWYAALIHRHNVAPNPEQVSQMRRGYPWRGILDGNFAMWALMYSERGGQIWPQAWEMNWGVVPLPRDRSSATLGMVNGVMISAQTEHPEASWAWASFLSRQMPLFLMPARRSLAESPEYEQRVGAEVAITARSAVEGAVLVNPDLLGFEQALGALQAAFEAIRSGEASPEAALNAAQQSSGF